MADTRDLEVVGAVPPPCYQVAHGCAGFRAHDPADQTTYVFVPGGEVRITIIVLVALLVLGLWVTYATHDCEK